MDRNVHDREDELLRLIEPGANEENNGDDHEEPVSAASRMVHPLNRAKSRRFSAPERLQQQPPSSRADDEHRRAAATELSGVMDGSSFSDGADSLLDTSFSPEHF